ncbi:MAG: hypothetical protein M3350_00590 [Actinomycetota bacterium]|nr:hypothetical protein [Actinomycetota bacterium]MDQ3719284.1 hypothetical protein [Actinomycetota bacterium]
MSEPALSVAFFDPARRIHGLARAGATLLFEDTHSTVLDQPARIGPSAGGYAAAVEGRFEIELEPASEPAELAGTRVWVCRARGTVDGAPVEGLGTVSESLRPPSWEDLDALRALSLLADSGHALLAVARRPRGVAGHGDELISAVLLSDGQLADAEEARLSTVYDGEGRQRSAGLELWLPGEDFPRRASGAVAAGSSLELEGLNVHAAVFRWSLEGRDAYGQYELAVRAPVPEAA